MWIISNSKSLQVTAMTLDASEIQFVTNGQINTTFFTPNGEWEFLQGSTRVYNLSTGSSLIPSLEVEFSSSCFGYDVLKLF